MVDMLSAILGSPPLTRGILLYKGLGVEGYGFTPAHAGNTQQACPSPAGSQVHPRSRGEYNGI